MKVLIVDNNQINREAISRLLREQQAFDIDGLLEAPNRVMGAMLIEAIDFDLVIVGGILQNALPDGTTDDGNGVALAAQLLAHKPATKIVLWSDNQALKRQFIQLLEQHHKHQPQQYCWPKALDSTALSRHLQQIHCQAHLPLGHLSELPAKL